MKRICLILILLLSLIQIQAQTREFKRIGLINPVPRNIEKLLFLIHGGYIKTDSFQIIGVLSKSQNELFKSVQRYVNEHGYNFITFELIPRVLTVDSLFIENSCTREFEKIFHETDAMIFLGGNDILPKIYGEKTFLTTEILPSDQNWEISFLFHLIGSFKNNSFVPFLEKRKDYVIIGICLGMQEMNVASGGTLYQDIPYQIYNAKSYEEITQLPVDNQHKNYWSRVDNMHADITPFTFHRIQIVKGSFLRFDNDDKPLVASAHHQSVKDLGKNFKIEATSMDGKVIESIMNQDYKNVYGIQFHTDFPILYDENAKFESTPDHIFQLSELNRLYYIHYWNNFSDRLREQKSIPGF